MSRKKPLPALPRASWSIKRELSLGGHSGMQLSSNETGNVLKVTDLCESNPPNGVSNFPVSAGLSLVVAVVAILGPAWAPLIVRPANAELFAAENARGGGICQGGGGQQHHEPKVQRRFEPNWPPPRQGANGVAHR